MDVKRSHAHTQVGRSTTLANLQIIRPGLEIFFIQYFFMQIQLSCPYELAMKNSEKNIEWYYRKFKIKKIQDGCSKAKTVLVYDKITSFIALYRFLGLEKLILISFYWFDPILTFSSKTYYW